jgi:hypothetical protein
MVRRLSVASRERGAESPVYAAEPSASAGRDEPAARAGIDVRSPATTVAGLLATAHGGLPVTAAPQRAATRRAGCRPARRKMVCKGHPCIYMADGDSRVRFASSKAVPCGRRLPRKLTDVHGREG